MLLSAIDEVDDDAADGPGALYDAYLDRLRESVDVAGAETVAAETDLAAETVERLGSGEVAGMELDLETAAAVLALEPDAHDAETIRLEVLDELLLGMTTAVVDVETLAANVTGEMTPTGIQQRLEGRAPMTLEELAAIQWFLNERSP